MLGVELFHQTPNVIGGMGSTGFSSGTLFHQPSSEIGVTQSTGFNIGGITISPIIIIYCSHLAEDFNTRRRRMNSLGISALR